LNWTHQFLISADDADLLGENTNTIKKGTEAALYSTKKNEYIFMSPHWNEGPSHNIKITNKSFENVAKFKYFRAPMINEEYIHEEIKNRLNSGLGSHHSVHSL
jgi:hypothetical protein